MTSTDLHRTIDSALGTFLALMFVEGLLKPTARFLSRRLIKTLDKYVRFLPDWLWDPSRNG
jgi:hypothetical protein